MFGGREYATGLGNIASSTGGAILQRRRHRRRRTRSHRFGHQLFLSARCGGAADRRAMAGRTGEGGGDASEGVGPRARRDCGSRAARSHPASRRSRARWPSRPTSRRCPFEVATYVTHADEPDKVRVIVSATVPESPGFVPAEWGYLVLDGGKVIGGSREQITETSAERWAASAGLVVPAGRYRIRAALVAADGRVATLDLPLHAGLRAAGSVQASDLIVGTPSEGRVEPRARLRQGDAGRRADRDELQRAARRHHRRRRTDPRGHRPARAAERARAQGASEGCDGRGRPGGARSVGADSWHLHGQRRARPWRPAFRAHQPDRRRSAG